MFVHKLGSFNDANSKLTLPAKTKQNLQRRIIALTIITFIWMFLIGCIPDMWTGHEFIFQQPPSMALWPQFIAFIYSDFVFNMGLAFISVIMASLFFWICALIKTLATHIENEESLHETTFHHYELCEMIETYLSFCQWFLLPFLFCCTSQILTLLYDMLNKPPGTNAWDEEVLSCIEQLLLVITILIPAAITTGEGEKLGKIAAKRRALSAKNNNINIADIASFQFYLSSRKLAVELAGITISWSILVTIGYTLLSVLMVIFKNKLSSFSGHL